MEEACYPVLVPRGVEPGEAGFKLAQKPVGRMHQGPFEGYVTKGQGAGRKPLVCDCVYYHYFVVGRQLKKLRDETGRVGIDIGEQLEAKRVSNRIQAGSALTVEYNGTRSVS